MAEGRSKRSIISSVGLAAALVVGLSCGGDDGSNADTELSGVVWIGGPVESADVIAYQLVDGARTRELARTRTAADGSWSLVLGLALESIDLEARGGAYGEASGGTVTLDTSFVLRGIALDVDLGEKRRNVAITPWTHLVRRLGDARLGRGDKEGTFNEAMGKARDLVAAHLDFDPTRTPIASLSAPAGSPTAEVRHALALAGLSELAGWIAADGGQSVQSVNTTTLLSALAIDVGAEDAVFDGNGDALTVGPACALPTGCDARGDGCRASCHLYWNTLRSRLGLAIAAFVADRDRNGTGLRRSDVWSWLLAVAGNDEPELFGGPVEALDTEGPAITWVAPQAGAVVAGDVGVEVTAEDPVGVASLTVAIVSPVSQAVTDTDATPERFAGTFDTRGLPEGELTLRATAVDGEGNESTRDLTVTVDNIDGGTVSGVVVKGRVSGATVQVFRYPGGVKGALLGQGTTASDGTFTNIALTDGYSGPILIEAGGGGTYAEEAATATMVTLDVNDRLRAVVPTYADGQAIAVAAVTPLSSFAVTYYEYLRTQQVGTFAEVWAAARAAIEAHVGVPDLVGLAPQRPSEMTTLSATARYGLVLAGLSRLAWQASTQGGGDGGTFGSSMHAVRVWKVLDQDLADGCWNGRAGATPLVFGGTQAVTADTPRKVLADAIVSYLGSGANQTPWSGPADVLPLLETLSQSGPEAGQGSACAPGELFPTPGQSYDQIPPVVTFESPTPAAGLVRQTIMLRAVATDNLSAPVASWTAPVGLMDTDGVPNNHIVTGTINTTMLTDGPLTVTARAVDASGNAGQASRTFTVDNTPPVLTVSSTGYLVDDGPPATWWTTSTGPTLTGTATDANGVTVAALIGASTYTATFSGSTWTVNLPGGSIAAGGTDVTIRATDGAGNQTSAVRRLRSDTTPPVVALVNTSVSVESMDVVTWNGDGTPHHEHTTTTATLGPATACTAMAAPHVTKYAYLLDEGNPLYGTENERNPLAWAFQVGDDGVGIDPAGTQYRVLQGGTTLVDWRPVSNPMQATHTVPLYRRVNPGSTWPAIPALGTVEDLFQIEFRGRDRFGRITTATRCWNHHPLAVPFQIDAMVAATNGSAGKYALALLSLPGNSPIAAQILNNNAPGAGMTQIGFSNATTEDIYVTFDLTHPTHVTHRRNYQYTHAVTSEFTSYCGCVNLDPNNPDPECTGWFTTPECTYLTLPASEVFTGSNTMSPASNFSFTLRLWETTGGTFAEIPPCAGCENTATRKEFRVPGRAAGEAVRTFQVMTVVSGLDEVRPGGDPPYNEFGLTYIQNSSTFTNTFTGRLHETVTRCAPNSLTTSSQTGIRTCTKSQTLRRYRALGLVSVSFTGATSVGTFATPAPDLAAGDPQSRGVRLLAPPAWSTSETLPTPIP